VKTLRSLKPVMDRSEVLRYLGYHPDQGRIPPRYESLIDEEMEKALSLVEPIGCYEILPPEAADNYPRTQVVEYVALAITTIGPHLEEEVEALMRRGELTRAMILDAVGSMLVEATADQINFEICRKARKMGLSTRRRRSPGYGAWNLEAQQWLFSVIDGNSIGVRLTESLMMVPRKSISMGVALVRGEEDEQVSPCTRCGFRDCSFRRM
jgi:hypothetical protein